MVPAQFFLAGGSTKTKQNKHENVLERHLTQKTDQQLHWWHSVAIWRLVEKLVKSLNVYYGKHKTFDADSVVESVLSQTCSPIAEEINTHTTATTGKCPGIKSLSIHPVRKRKGRMLTKENEHVSIGPSTDLQIGKFSDLNADMKKSKEGMHPLRLPMFMNSSRSSLAMNFASSQKYKSTTGALLPAVSPRHKPVGSRRNRNTSRLNKIESLAHLSPAIIAQRGHGGLVSSKPAIVNPSPIKRLGVQTRNARLAYRAKPSPQFQQSSSCTAQLPCTVLSGELIKKDENTSQIDKSKRVLRRSGTFDLVKATLGAASTPEVKPSKHESETSPDIQTLLDSMSGDMSSAERSKRLMSALDERVEGKLRKYPIRSVNSRNPQSTECLAMKSDLKKPITPGNKDWEKLHRREFEKFDSIDVYLQKKRKRAEDMSASVKKTRFVISEVREAVNKLKKKGTPNISRNKSTDVFKPTVLRTNNMDLDFTKFSSSKNCPFASGGNFIADSGKSSIATTEAFNPTIILTKDINLNFSAAVSPAFGVDKNSHTHKNVGYGKTGLAKKYVSCTPLKFTGSLNTSRMNSVSKPMFDLESSLAQPLTWTPHKGKLKPIGTPYKKHEDSSVKPSANVSRMDVFKSAVNKTRVTYSRNDRRAASAVKRANARTAAFMNKRTM